MKGVVWQAELGRAGQVPGSGRCGLHATGGRFSWHHVGRDVFTAKNKTRDGSSFGA